MLKKLERENLATISTNVLNLTMNFAIVVTIIGIVFVSIITTKIEKQRISNQFQTQVLSWEFHTFHIQHYSQFHLHKNKNLQVYIRFQHKNIEYLVFLDKVNQHLHIWLPHNSLYMMCCFDSSFGNLSNLHLFFNWIVNKNQKSNLRETIKLKIK